MADDELAKARKLARSLDDKIKEHLTEKRAIGLPKDMRERFDSILGKYAKAALASASEVGGEDAKNLYSLVGAKRLARANAVSRLVSTHLGSAWEEMAAESHLAMSPELVFGKRITGVDVVILEKDVLRHTQIKTQRNTLTGSQTGRSVAELKLHPRPLFAAAFEVAPWTFPPYSTCGIERIAGKAFWEKLAIEYAVVFEAAKVSLLRLEKELFD
jgi:hypothetical protein